jgi:hypothetical protein
LLARLADLTTLLANLLELVLECLNLALILPLLKRWWCCDLREGELGWRYFVVDYRRWRAIDSPSDDVLDNTLDDLDDLSRRPLTCDPSPAENVNSFPSIAASRPSAVTSEFRHAIISPSTA